MRIYTDDDLRRVDSRFLGLPGFTFFWNPTRYAAYGFGALVFLAVAFVFATLAGWGVWTVIYSVAATVVITSTVMRRVDSERPLAAWAPLVWGEIGAPRGSRHAAPRTCRTDLAAVAVFTPGPGRALTRLHTPPNRRPNRGWRR